LRKKETKRKRKETNETEETLDKLMVID